MIESLNFVNGQWFWQVLIAVLILCILFIWKESYRFKQKGFFINVIVGLIGLVMLGMLALKPQSSVITDGFKIVIITDDYKESKLDSLKKIESKLKIVQYNIGETLIDPNEIPSQIYILGNGIPLFDHWQFEDIPTSYLGESNLTGITKLKYKPTHVLGAPIILKGQFNNPKKAHQLVLEGPGKVGLDSIVFEQDSIENFQLDTAFDIKGNYLLSLVEKDSIGNHLSSNPLPLTIVDENALRILILNRFPTFETKYLKNYLSEMGHQVVIRSQITKDRFKYEYFNLSEQPSTEISQKNLTNYDLLIIDANSINNLSRNNLNQIESAIKDEGLGVFIQADKSLSRSVSYIKSFTFNSDKIDNIQLSEWPRTNISKYPFNFQDDFELEPVHTSNGTIFSGYKRLGEGRIGTTVFNNTYELILNGNILVYKDLWSSLINGLSKRTVTTTEWHSETFLVYKDEPFSFQLRTSIKKPTIRTDQRKRLALMADIDIPQLWHGKTYPNTTGWHELVLDEDSTQVFNYYVMDSSKWHSLRTQNTISSNKRQFDGNSESSEILRSLKPINPFWFYGVFLLCIGYLWLEPKL
jgi:hypothetical protein